MSSKISRAHLFEVLNHYLLPGSDQSLMTMKAVKQMDVEGSAIVLHVELPDLFQPQREEIQQSLRSKLLDLPGVETAEIHFAWHSSPRAEIKNLIPSVKYCVVVGSGKGGVGKSTLAANLACALAQQGLKVGLLDADLYGPSIPIMFGLKDQPQVTEDEKIEPLEKFGLKLMSIGLLLDEDRPVVWRGPMLNKALTQFLSDVVWGDLDLLLVDLPPGTGDTQISLVQNAPIAGAIVVSTPQDVAFLDARKAMAMFGMVGVPVLGLVENMSSFLCPHCGTETQIFGHGGVQKAAESMELPFLGEIPIDLAIREGSDCGVPLVIGHPASPQALAFHEIARRLKAELEMN